MEGSLLLLNSQRASFSDCSMHTSIMAPIFYKVCCRRSFVSRTIPIRDKEVITVLADGTQINNVC